MFVHPWLLRRVIRRDRGAGTLGRREARLRSYEISGQALASIVDHDDLPQIKGQSWTSRVLLLERPDADELASKSADAVLLEMWRWLFRARTRAMVRARLDAGEIDVEERIAEIGRTEFEEVRLVLRQDGLIAADESNAAVYAEFASIFLELTYFAPALRAHAFPAIEDIEGVEALLDHDADGQALRDATRPRGAPDPVEPLGSDPETTGDEPEEPSGIETEPLSALQADRMVVQGKASGRAWKRRRRGGALGEVGQARRPGIGGECET